MTSNTGLKELSGIFDYGYYLSLQLFAFNKERLHSTVSFKNFGLSVHGHQFGPPKKLFWGEIIQGE